MVELLVQGYSMTPKARGALMRQQPPHHKCPGRTNPQRVRTGAIFLNVTYFSVASFTANAIPLFKALLAIGCLFLTESIKISGMRVNAGDA